LNLESLATALSNKNGPKAQEIQSAMKQEVVECLLKTKVFSSGFRMYFSLLVYSQNIFRFTNSTLCVGNSCNSN
jgi:hypothetical protein